jgi:hypothetical protein
MERKIYVTGIYRKEPNIGLYVLALIALVRQLQDEEEQATAEQGAGQVRRPTDPEEAADD